MEKEYSKEFDVIFEEKDKNNHVSEKNQIFEADKTKKVVPEELQEINSHREIISKIAYLIGVKKYFLNMIISRHN